MKEFIHKNWKLVYLLFILDIYLFVKVFEKEGFSLPFIGVCAVFSFSIFVLAQSVRHKRISFTAIGQETSHSDNQAFWNNWVLFTGLHIFFVFMFIPQPESKERIALPELEEKLKVTEPEN